ncbi:MAG: hypothetical protein AB7K63_20695, partial [Vicinamibacterales bacterium]
MARIPSARRRLRFRRAPHAFPVVIVAALGAFWAPPRSAAAQQKTTFSRDVAPILYTHCVECHRPNAAAPFSLIGYADA